MNSPIKATPEWNKPATGEARGEAVSELERQWRQRIHERVLRVLDLSRMEGSDERLARAQVREAAQRVMNEETVPLPVQARQRVVQQIEDDILGLGPLEPLLSDPSVADILVNGAHSVYVERRGRLEKTEIQFRDESHLRSVIDRIVTRVGRRVDESSPMVDARLADGSRVNAIVPPLALDGSLLSIRRFTVGRLTAEQLIANGAMTEAMARFLNAVVHARLNVLISGGTGSGKTTLLNVLSTFIPSSERILTIEDSAELQLQQPHVGRMETRPSNVEGKGEVSQRDLLRNALRMRPDRIIVGEVRSGEAFDMLQAMNTGHDGSLTTVHANTPRDALARVENMVTMAGTNLPLQTIRAQIASAIHIVIQAERMEDGKRRVVSIQEIQGMEGQVITMSEIFTFRRMGLDKDGMVIGRFEATGMVPRFIERMHQRGLDLPPDLFEPPLR
ncbi:pilus assembly protein CpaF [Solimonas aquatica]|uniref:Pilus assembly protein CpaF n=1 Tax=Solimonas aquatica TaxID=489703 RepID=A0A1H9HXT5_9GAMM|nr:CpaF family protein [Solimonas aquatica]SEQ67150.1 pilus assembly protein CpaF [Solimonas aquatica]